jgi:hypothetical protein
MVFDRVYLRFPSIFTGTFSNFPSVISRLSFDARFTMEYSFTSIFEEKVPLTSHSSPNSAASFFHHTGKLNGHVCSFINGFPACHIIF